MGVPFTVRGQLVGRAVVPDHPEWQLLWTNDARVYYRHQDGRASEEMPTPLEGQRLPYLALDGQTRDMLIILPPIVDGMDREQLGRQLLALREAEDMLRSYRRQLEDGPST